MTRLKAEEMLQVAIITIENDLELSPGMIDRVMAREALYPGDPLASELKKLIAAKLDPEARAMLAAETEPTQWC